MKKILMLAMMLGLLIIGSASATCVNKSWKEMTIDERLECVITLEPGLSVNEIALRNAETYDEYRTATQDDINKWKEEEQKKNEIIEQKRKAEEIAREKQRQAKIASYPPEIQAAIKARSVMLGMTREQAELAWGKPNHINRSVGKWGVHEQWVYDYSYLYFENGILTSWQN